MGLDPLSGCPPRCQRLSFGFYQAVAAAGELVLAHFCVLSADTVNYTLIYYPAWDRIRGMICDFWHLRFDRLHLHIEQAVL